MRKFVPQVADINRSLPPYSWGPSPSTAQLSQQGSPSLPSLDARPFWLPNPNLSRIMDIMSSTSNTSVDHIEAIPLLRSFFAFRNVNAVSSFLRENPFLIRLLLGAHFTISERFEDKPPLALEVFVNPEEVGQDHLRLLVETNLDIEEALDRTLELYEGWFNGILPATHNKLLIAIETV